MSNQLGLIPGQKYRVIKAFTDHDQNVHQPGNTWTFLGTDFLPYHDGLTVLLRLDGNPKTLAFRLQQRPEEQADLIHNFKDYVEAVND